MLNSYIEPVLNNQAFFTRIYIYYHAVANIICCFLFVFLSSLFVPIGRKYAMLVAVLMVFSLAVCGLYFNFTDSKTYGEITLRLLLNYLGMFVGLLIGVYVSYEVFKNKGWSPRKNIEENKEVF